MAVNSMPSPGNDVRLIEAGFPCHQVGRRLGGNGASSALPPLYYLHVWWARRPLTPAEPLFWDHFYPLILMWIGSCELGIEQVQADVNGVRWCWMIS